MCVTEGLATRGNPLLRTADSCMLVVYIWTARMNAKKRAMIIYKDLAEIPMRLLGTGNRGKLEVINNCSDRGSEPDICHNRFDNRGKLEFQLILGNCTPHCKINYKSLVLVMLY